MADYTENEERPTKRQRLSPTISDVDATALVNNAQAKSESIDNGNNITTDPRELEVGVTEYVSDDVLGFRAYLKTRYTDFLVNEILPGGEVVHLTDTSVPKNIIPSGSNKDQRGKQNGRDITSSATTVNGSKSIPASDGVNSAAEKPKVPLPDEHKSKPEAPESAEVSDEDQKLLVSFLSEKAVTELLQLYKSILRHPTRKPKDHNLVRTQFTDDRSVRAEIHAAIRRIFHMKIESSTDNEGFLCLLAANLKAPNPRKQNNQGQESRHHPGKLGWLERGGDYLHFTLCKENKDTMEAISFLVRQMKVSAKTFQFAGTKDRRAVSSQRVSAYRLDAERLAKVNSYLRNALVGNFEYRKSPLELGELGGNEFILTLRECAFPGLSNLDTEDQMARIQSALELALANLHSKGFLNYYGLQRFGTFSTTTDTVGLHILKHDFRAACDAILDYDSGALAALEADTAGETSILNPNTGHNPSRDEILRAKAIRLFKKTGNSHQALEILPRKFNAENQLIRHLSRTPADYIGALLAIPRNLRLMYVHAYQSLVWNKATTNRWRLSGSTVLEGDLVLVKEHENKENTTTGEPEPEIESGAIDADGEIIIVPPSHDRSNAVDDVFERARALTATEAASGQYSIFDLVLPLPGFDVTYPANKSGEFYKTYMGSEEGGRLDPHDMRRKQKDFSLSGGYRKIVAGIGPEFNVSVHRYARDEEQFVETDLERVHARNKPQSNEKEHAQETESAAVDANTMDVDVQDQPSTTTDARQLETSAGDEEAKDKIAVVLKFQLGASQYATMALRELSRGGITAYKVDIGTAK